MNKSPLSFKAASLATLICLFMFSSIVYVSCNKDECDGVICNNEGACTDGKCSCLTGFSGSSREIADAKKFEGVYSGINLCDNSNMFRIDTTIQNNVFINMNIGIGTCAKNLNVQGTVVGDTIRFPPQGFLDLCQNSYAFSADGFMRNDSLIITLRYNFPTYKD